ncbi:MAG: peptide transporter [Firmicutes bacterium]|nr:peptide transporter [Bacillota bacterium]
MENEKGGKVRYAETFKEQLTIRSVVLGMLGAVIITASSTYVALRMGALPWPTIFVAILSLTILKALGKTNINEINVTHTAMSAGGLVAGGLAFTIPGIWMVNPDAKVSFFTLIVITLCGTVLGLIFTGLIRKHFIEGERLPFPMGIAASQTLIAGDEGGKKGRYLFSSLGFAAVFTALRDQFGVIPAALTSQALFARNIFFGAWLSPMAAGIGYIIGPLYMGTWFLGAFLSYFLIIPIGVSTGVFSNVDTATAFKNSMGIGLIVGSGVGVLIKGVLPKAKEIFAPMLKGEVEKGEINMRWAPFVFALAALIVTFLTEMSLISSILTIIGVWVTVAMAATITGQTGINPMEIFGILVLLFIKIFVKLGFIESFLIAAVVAIACGLAGDALQDFKAGYILKTDPRAQLVSEGVGGLIGAFVSVIVLFIMHNAYGAMGPGTELVAPQAYAVSTMVKGLPNPSAFVIGLILGALLYFIKIPGMTIGIGMYLPMVISTTAGVGGVLRFIMDKKYPKSNENGTLISSGFLGGEGVTGVLLAIIKVLTAA